MESWSLSDNERENDSRSGAEVLEEEEEGCGRFSSIDKSIPLPS